MNKDKPPLWIVLLITVLLAVYVMDSYCRSTSIINMFF